MSLRSSSLALMPIDLGEVADGDRRLDLAARLLRTGATARRVAAALLAFGLARTRRASSSLVEQGGGGLGEVTRRSVARSFRRARRPARSADEPTPPLGLLSSSSSSERWSRGDRRGCGRGGCPGGRGHGPASGARAWRRVPAAAAAGGPPGRDGPLGRTTLGPARRDRRRPGGRRAVPTA